MISKAFRFRCGASLAATRAGGRAMFHTGTQTMIDAWEALAETAGGVPARADLDPAVFPALTPQLLMLERRGEGLVRFAGGWAEAFLGRPLKGADWLSLWRSESRPLAALAARQAWREGRPVVLAAEAGAAFEPLEITLAPLRAQPERLIALVQPLTAAGRATERVGLLGAAAVMAVGEARRAPLARAAQAGRRVA
jgi:hypothetical protein